MASEPLITRLVYSLRDVLEAVQVEPYCYSLPVDSKPESIYAVIVPESESRPQDGSRKASVTLTIVNRAIRSEAQSGGAEDYEETLEEAVANVDEKLQSFVADPDSAAGWQYDGSETEYDFSGYPTIGARMTLSFTYYQFI